MSVARTSSALAAALAAAVVAGLTLVPGASASPTEASKPGLRERAAELSAGRGTAAAPAPGTVQRQEVRCFTDPSGDTDPPGDARGDVRGFCASNDPSSIGVSLTPGQPTDPATDPGWAGITGLIWDLDVDGDELEDFSVVYVAGTVSVEDSVSGEQLCETAQKFDGTTYSADFPASCIGAPSSFSVSAFMAYDSDPDNPDAPVYADITDYAGPVQATGGTTPPPSGGRSTGRLAGSDRYATAVAISANVFPGGAPIVFLARADAFADALAGGTLSRGPILLVPQCGAVPEVVKAEVRRLGATEVVALGGPGAVCDSVLLQVANA